MFLRDESLLPGAGPISGLDRGAASPSCNSCLGGRVQKCLCRGRLFFIGRKPFLNHGLISGALDTDADGKEPDLERDEEALPFAGYKKYE